MVRHQKSFVTKHLRPLELRFAFTFDTYFIDAEDASSIVFYSAKVLCFTVQHISHGFQAAPP